MTADDLLKQIERLAHETGAFAIVRDREQQKAFEQALMRFGVACFREALADAKEMLERLGALSFCTGQIYVDRLDDLDGIAKAAQEPPFPWACGGCGGHAHLMVDGDQRWLECTHGCGWTSRGPTRFNVR